MASPSTVRGAAQSDATEHFTSTARSHTATSRAGRTAIHSCALLLLKTGSFSTHCINLRRTAVCFLNTRDSIGAWCTPRRNARLPPLPRTRAGWESVRAWGITGAFVLFSFRLLMHCAGVGRHCNKVGAQSSRATRRAVSDEAERSHGLLQRRPGCPPPYPHTTVRRRCAFCGALTVFPRATSRWCENDGASVALLVALTIKHS